MKELNDCLKLRREINEVKERIEELKMASYSAKNQIITGMPRGNGTTDTGIERYIVLSEELKDKLTSLMIKENEIWSKIWNYTYNILTDEEMALLSNRFHLGYSWKKCGEGFGWNENKVFRTYRNALRKIKEKGKI